MPLLSLIARLGLDKTGFDAGLDGAVKSADRFSNQFSRKIGNAFGAAAVIAGAHKIGQIMREIATDSSKANDQFATIGKQISPDDVALLKEYVRHWDEFGTKLKFIGATIGKGVAGFHESAAGTLDNIRDYGKLIIDFLNPFSGKRSGDLKDEWNMIGTRQQLSAFGPNLLERDPNEFENAKKLNREIALNDARRHMAIQDEILKIEKETNDLNEKTRVSKLTTAQRIKELTEQAGAIGGTEGDGLDAITRRNRLALINSELANLTGKRGQSSIASTELGRIGAFQGTSPASSIAQVGRQQISELQRIRYILDSMHREFKLE